MKWHSEELQCKDQPEKATIYLEGIFTAPQELDIGQSTIVLRLSIEPKPGDTLIQIVLFTKNPSFLAYQEPQPHEVRTKYYTQITKARKRVMSATLDEILSW